MVEAGGSSPVQYVAVSLKKTDGTVVQNTVTDPRGQFALEQVPAGEYVLAYGRLGADTQLTAPFTVNEQHPRVDLGTLALADNVVRMSSFEVKATQAAAQLNSIDRKVYNVGQDIQSATGTASDLLQNVPSVQVDIDGNVSLRGSSNVLILINGRTSTLMGQSRADILAQLPADEIDKIEVITNPSAKYKPDGTAGIINIALKRRHGAGFAGSTTVSVGNDRRGNAGVAFNYYQAARNVSGSYSVRQDDRPRFAVDDRVIVDAAAGTVTHANKRTEETGRPLSHLLRAGFDYAPGEHTQLGLSGNFNQRSFLRQAIDHNLVSDATGAVTQDYDRSRYDPEFRHSLEISANLQHTFDQSGHVLKIDATTSGTNEQEDNLYTDTYRQPALASTEDRTLIKVAERSTELTADYTRPIGSDTKLGAGYAGTLDRFDADFLAADLDPVTGQWVTDVTKTNHFIHERFIQAFYSTYARALGAWGVQAGLRPELVHSESRLVTTGETILDDYFRVYPSLHLSYHLAEEHELQANYSRRVHRADIDNLNPFPEFVDPFNLKAGNPRLKPEDIHSIEAGYGFRRGDISFTSTVYRRYIYDGVTSVTTSLGNGVLLTTKQNLTSSHETGVEVTANGDISKWLSLNFSGNVFFNTIDASNLGFSESKSDRSWLAKLSASIRLPQATTLQVNANYGSARLLPQGTRRPTFVTNVGLRKEIWQKKAAFVLTVSDVFNSLRETIVLDTPALREETVRRRSTRIIYAGFSYNFGKPAKKSKDDAMSFDNAL